MWLQARAADEAGIQFRMLNASKGPAVRGPRAQMDRSLYKEAMQRLVEQQPNLAVHDGAVTDLILERAASGSQASVSGVTLASGKQAPVVRRRPAPVALHPQFLPIGSFGFCCRLSTAILQLLRQRAGQGTCYSSTDLAMWHTGVPLSVEHPMHLSHSTQPYQNLLQKP